MKLNLPSNPPPNPGPLPVDATGAGPDSEFPAALATCAPDALLCPTRVELDRRWLKAPCDSALAAWIKLLNRIAIFHPHSERN